MDWITGIQNAIHDIEEHITEELDYERHPLAIQGDAFLYQWSKN